MNRTPTNPLVPTYQYLAFFSSILFILHVETTISSFNSFPDARSVIHLICKDRKESLSHCNRMKPLLYFCYAIGIA